MYLGFKSVLKMYNMTVFDKEEEEELLLTPKIQRVRKNRNRKSYGSAKFRWERNKVVQEQWSTMGYHFIQFFKIASYFFVNLGNRYGYENGGKLDDEDQLEKVPLHELVRSVES